MDAFAACDKVIYPNVLIPTTPTVSVGHTSYVVSQQRKQERSFSTLKRIETYLRNSVGEARLNGLAMLSIYRDIDVDVQTVIAMDDLNC